MTQSISASQYRAMKTAPKNKYGAKRTTVGGITFDSKAEADHYLRLRLLEKAGEISALERQKPFLLVAGAGKLVGTYRADFVFFDHAMNRQRVLDVKGFDTPLSKFKRKFVRALYGIEVEIVR
ncbi:MAG: DUF1064 domain-containing protein [Patescibacteria group bacterium]|nr:DUF1064 domain-containing protein [Patescibacteria group bacterium]